MGIFPLNGFYFLMCAHFLMCLLCLWTSSMDANDLLGILLVIQAICKFEPVQTMSSCIIFVLKILLKVKYLIVRHLGIENNSIFAYA